MGGPFIVVRGGGDLATGTINRLYKAGVKIAVLEIDMPTVIRLKVSAALAVFENEAVIEGVRYVLAENAQTALKLIKRGLVPVLVDPDMKLLKDLKPDALVDATLAKKNMGVHKALAPIVIALGPGFVAGEDCHAVIETSRGHDLGVILYEGTARANTGVPGKIAGYAEERVLRAPGAGYFKAVHKIGDFITKGQAVGKVEGQEVYAEIDGVIRGLIHERVPVFKGMKIGDVDPRANVAACTSISDKARALGGSVLEAYLALSNRLKSSNY